MIGVGLVKRVFEDLIAVGIIEIQFEVFKVFVGWRVWRGEEHAVACPEIFFKSGLNSVVAVLIDDAPFRAVW